MAYRDGMNNRHHGFITWLTHLNIYKVVAMLLTLIIIFTIVTVNVYSSLNGLENGNGRSTTDPGAKPEYIGRNLKKTDLTFQIEELKRIKNSVSNELRELESKRQKLYAEINNYTGQIEDLKKYHLGYVKDIDKLKIGIENVKLEQEDLSKRNMPDIQAPKRMLPSASDSVPIPAPSSSFYCGIHNCFDYSRCPLSSQFPVYYYDAGGTYSYSTSGANLEKFIKFSVSHAIESSPHVTFDAHIACVYIVLIGDIDGGLQIPAPDLQQKLYKLSHWKGDGRNHVLLNIARSYSNRDIFAGVDIGRAMVVQSSFLVDQYRKGFDIIIPPTLGIPHGQVWDQLPHLVPARRKHLLTFEGHLPFLSQYVKPSTLIFNNNAGLHKSMQNPENIVYNLVQFEKSIVDTLKTMQKDYSFYNFNYKFTCDNERIDGYEVEWSICGPDSQRHDLLKESTFSLVIAPLNNSVISTTLLQTRIYEALKFGAIPVILGNYVKLPFEDLLPWKQAAIVLPKERVTELHYYLRSISDTDILEYRRQGRILWETHFGTTKSIIHSILATLRIRINIPAFPIKEESSPSVFNSTFVPIKEDILPEELQQPESDDDYLGPVDQPFPSERFRRNFTSGLNGFSSPGDWFHQFPSSPFDPVLPGEAKFLGSSYGFRPINKGAGGAGKEFSEALGGNFPREQFTIVMLTYEREAVMTNAVARLKGLPHLNKVIVVWNSPNPPSPDLRWPNIQAPVHVVKTSRNSLNNRFLPYDAIETDAILSIDDDAHLRHDEIIFGFRAWRENRDRLVGFPGRFHAWDMKHDSWNYNSNYSCELSMVLTGAAFFHKYYAYLYSYVMPQAIRDKVDEYLNCEDLAMNFLVSHITRKPPVKVTSRWTFRCPGCPVALSVDEEHFFERHKCMNFFVKMPAISKSDPRYYVKQVALPIPVQKGIKIQARCDKVYNPTLPSRDDIRKDNYKRRFKQMNEQGFHAATHKPYQEVGHPLHLDHKKLILHALGQWNESHEVDSSSSSDSEEEEGTKKQPQQQKAFTTTNFFVRRTRKDLNTLKKEDIHSKALIRNVRLGQGLFYTLRKEREKKVQAEHRELRKRREQQKNEWQPPRQDSSSSGGEETDEDLAVDVDLKEYIDEPPPEKEAFMTEVTMEKQTAASPVTTEKALPSPDISINVTVPETPAVPESVKASRVAFHGVDNLDSPAYSKSVYSAKSGQTLATSSRALSTKRGKSQPPRPYTPQHSNINSETDYVLDKEALFRQLCALYWLLEAMNTDNPNIMAPISTCWNMREIGGTKGKDRKQEKDRLDINWNKFVIKQGLKLPPLVESKKSKSVKKVPTHHHYDASRPWRNHTQTHHVTRYLSHLRSSHVTHGSGHATPSSRSASPAHSFTSHEEGDDPVTTTLLALPEEPLPSKPKLVAQTKKASYFFKAVCRFKTSVGSRESVANGKRSSRLGKPRRFTGFQSQFRHRNSSFSMSRAGTPTGSQLQLNESLTNTGTNNQPPFIRVDSVIPEGGQRCSSQLDTGRDTEDDDDALTKGLFRFLDEYYDSLRNNEDSEPPDDRHSAAEVASSHSARSDRKGGRYTDSDYGRKGRLASTAMTQPQQYDPKDDIPQYDELSEQQITAILESIEQSYLDPRLHRLANPTERRTEKTMRADYNVRPKSSPAVLEFKNSLPSAKKKSLPRELRQQFAEAYQNKALILHDTLEALERERFRKVQNKFVHLPTEHSSFHRAVRTMRNRTVKEEEYLRESQRKQSLYQQWFTDLDSNIPEHFKQDWYLDKILTKLQKYGLCQQRKDGVNIMKQVEANKQSAYKFLMILTGLRDWEICSPDISAAIEFCRERIVEMPVEEYEDWFHQQFPKVIRPQTAPPAMKREDRLKREQEAAKQQALKPRVPQSAPPGGRKHIK